MKNIIKIVLLSSIIMVSCEDSSKFNMNIQDSKSTEAPYVQGVFKSTLLKYAKLSNSDVEISLSAPSSNVSLWETKVRIVSGTTVGEYFPLNNYKASSFPTTLTIPMSEIVKAMGKTIADIKPADIIQFSSTSIGLDGKKLTYDNLSGDIVGTAEQRQAYNFDIAISCAPVNNPSGTWTVEMTDGYGDGWDGAYLTAEVNDVATDYTITPNQGDKASHIIDIAAGETLTWSYTKGNFEEEHVFTITGPDGTVYGPYDGAVGIRFCFF